MYTWKYACLRFLCSALLTVIHQNKNYQPDKILTNNNKMLNTIGAIGLFLHHLTSPFSNPIFYLAPCLSGVAFGKTTYALYRKYFPVAN